MSYKNLESGEIIVKLIDYGLSCLYEDWGPSRKGSCGHGAGTLAYMHPETQRIRQNKGKIRPLSRSELIINDIYAVGATLFEITHNRSRPDSPRYVKSKLQYRGSQVAAESQGICQCVYQFDIITVNWPYHKDSISTINCKDLRTSEPELRNLTDMAAEPYNNIPLWAHLIIRRLIAWPFYTSSAPCSVHKVLDFMEANPVYSVAKRDPRVQVGFQIGTDIAQSEKYADDGMIIKQQQLRVPTTSELQKAMHHVGQLLDMPTISNTSSPTPSQQALLLKQLSFSDGSFASR